MPCLVPYTMQRCGMESHLVTSHPVSFMAPIVTHKQYKSRRHNALQDEMRQTLHETRRYIHIIRCSVCCTVLSCLISSQHSGVLCSGACGGSAWCGAAQYVVPSRLTHVSGMVMYCLVSSNGGIFVYHTSSPTSHTTKTRRHYTMPYYITALHRTTV